MRKNPSDIFYQSIYNHNIFSWSFETNFNPVSPSSIEKIESRGYLRGAYKIIRESSIANSADIATESALLLQDDNGQWGFYSQATKDTALVGRTAIVLDTGHAGFIAGLELLIKHANSITPTKSEITGLRMGEYLAYKIGSPFASAVQAFEQAGLSLGVKLDLSEKLTN